MKRDWKKGFRRLRPGVYDDGKGGLHIDEKELVEAAGYPATPQNIETLRKALVEMAEKGNFPVHEDHDPGEQ